MIRLSLGLKIWLVALVFFVIGVPVIFVHADVAVAQYFQFLTGRLNRLGEGLTGPVLLTLEATALVTLAVMRLVQGHMSRFSATLALALLASICAYGVNSSVLKVFFGVPTPGEVLQGTHHGLHFLQGSPTTSFPSGHLALSGGFAGVFWRIYRQSILPLALLLSLGGLVLVAGGWHFVSDVVAGGFMGLTAGLLAAEVWLRHEARQ